MIDTDEYERINNTKGSYLSKHGVTKLIKEVKRLREGIKQIAWDYDFTAIKSQSLHCARPTYDVPAGDGIHTVTFHQKACLKIMELIE